VYNEWDNKGERDFWVNHVDDQNSKDKNQLFEFWHHLPNLYLLPNFAVAIYRCPLLIGQTSRAHDLLFFF
jgi:hypothetical protein